MNKKEFSSNCLADALIDLLEDNEYEDISIQDIVDKAGFSRMAYYRNFKDKNEIIDYCLDNMFDTFIRKTDISYHRMGPERFFETMFTIFSDAEMVRITKLLLKRGLLGAIANQFVKRVQGGFLPNQSQHFYDFLAGGFFSVYLAWIRNGLKESPEEMTKEAMKYVTYLKEKGV